MVVDEEFMQQVVETVAPLPVCFHHMALDKLQQPVSEALAAIQRCGVVRVISTGRAENVMAGKETLKDMVHWTKEHNNKVVVTAATGVTAAVVHDLIAATGVPEVHASKFSEVAPALGKTPRAQNVSKL